MNNAVNYLSPFYDKQTIKLLHKIKPTNWGTLKTEAIDFNTTFYRLEDFPFQSEIKILKDNNKFGSLIKVDLNNFEELNRVQQLLSFNKNINS